uniref:Uncharacterized protein n=1 Tax=Arundo donax TaxID=35708 RepID=A0A0A8Z629_ARUDO
MVVVQFCTLYCCTEHISKPDYISEGTVTCSVPLLYLVQFLRHDTSDLNFIRGSGLDWVQVHGLVVNQRVV